MFNFFAGLKARVTSLELKVEAIFNHIHTELAAKTAAVADAPKAVVEDVASDAVAKVEAVATDVENKV